MRWGFGLRPRHPPIREYRHAHPALAGEPVADVIGRQERDADDANAIVLVEVSSASTEDYDQGGQLDHYERIEFLQR